MRQKEKCMSPCRTKQYGVGCLPRPATCVKVPYVDGAIPPLVSHQVSVYMHKKKERLVGEKLKNN